MINRTNIEMIRLIFESKKPVPSAVLATHFGISSRSVQNYIKEINFYYPDLITSSRSGYEVKNDMLAKEVLSDENSLNILPKTNAERYQYIVKKIMLSKYNHLKLSILMDELYLSLPSVKKLISFANKELAAFHLRLEMNGNEVTLHGKEIDQRKLFSVLILEESNHQIFRMDNLTQFFHAFDVDIAKKIIDYATGQHHYFTNEFGYQNLLIHLCILLSRLNMNQEEETHFSDTQIEDGYIDLIEGIHQIVLQNYSLVLNSYETYLLYIILKSNDKSKTSDVKNLQMMIDPLIEKVDELYHINLKTEHFLNFFTTHVNALLFRLQHQKTITNPFAESIRFTSPLIYDIASIMAFEFQKLTGYELNQNEIGFFALHIGAEMERQKYNVSKIKTVFLYNHYLDIKKNIFDDIRQTFHKDLEILQESNSIHQVSLRDVDLIITDQNYVDEEQYPVAVVSIDVLAREGNIERIFKKIKQLKNRRQTEILVRHFDTFFKKELFFLETQESTREQVIEKLSMEMYQHNYVSDQFHRYVLQREELSSTAFHGFAIPHQFIEETKQSCIAVLIDRQGVDWGQKKVNIVLLFNIASAHKSLFQELYPSIINFLSGNLDTVCKAESFQEFKKYVLAIVNESN